MDESVDGAGHVDVRQLMERWRQSGELLAARRPRLLERALLLVEASIAELCEVKAVDSEYGRKS